MEVAIAGGHGKIALLLGRLLAEREDKPWGLIRDPAQEDDLHAAGVEPVLCDFEAGDDVAEAVSGADAVVFAAGAGPGSGAERKWAVDYGAAAKLIEAAKADEELRASGLEYTIVRPGGLSDEEPTGLVLAGERLDRGEIPRADVAAVLLACLDTRQTIDRSFDLLAGPTPIAEALASL